MPILVHSVPMSIKKFTQSDLDLSEKYINPDVYPGLYNKDDIPPGLKYIGRQLISIKSFEYDDEDSIDKSVSSKSRHLSPDEAATQSARAYGRGAEAEKVFASVRNYGYKLNSIPMSVAIFPDGSKYLINGRTRLQELTANGFENIIADVYSCATREAYHDAKQLLNVREDPYSPHTMEDIILTARYAIRRGWIKNTYDDIKKKVERVAPGCFSYKEVNKIILRAMEDDSLSSSISWTSKSALKEIRKQGFLDNENNNGIYYFVYSSEAPVKAIPAAAKYLTQELQGKKVKELRVIIHTSTLQGADPEASWKGKTDNFRTAWKDYSQYIKDAFFGVNSDFSHKIKLFGVLPAVSGLKERYPMDKVVIFSSKLKNKLFSEIDLDANMVRNLLNFVDIDESETEDVE